MTNFIETSGETGFSKLVEARLLAEARNLEKNQQKVWSLVADAMRIKEKLQHHRHRDCCVGHADAHLKQGEQKNGDLVLADSLLRSVISGLTTPFRTPVAYYFTK